ncbi:hypothetical protein DL765_007810 [Monosporascus sp. GIB2]|nr:hypothetical protein DL765_007810 [Monosporascus sp. GIB2]
MKLQMMSAVALATLVHVSTANFDVYMADEQTAIPQVWPVWHIWDTDPNCDEVLGDNPNYLGSDDVSGDNVGVRCDADDLRDCVSQSAPAEAIRILEMNFNNDDPIYHWTIYQDRNYDMIGLDGNVYGNCILFPGNSYDCVNPLIGGFSGTRKFRCLTEFTAAQIKAEWGN